MKCLRTDLLLVVAACVSVLPAPAQATDEWCDKLLVELVGRDSLHGLRLDYIRLGREVAYLDQLIDIQSKRETRDATALQKAQKEHPKATVENADLELDRALLAEYRRLREELVPHLQGVARNLNDQLSYMKEERCPEVPSLAAEVKIQKVGELQNFLLWPRIKAPEPAPVEGPTSGQHYSCEDLDKTMFGPDRKSGLELQLKIAKQDEDYYGDLGKFGLDIHKSQAKAQEAFTTVTGRENAELADLQEEVDSHLVELRDSGLGPAVERVNTLESVYQKWRKVSEDEHCLTYAGDVQGPWTMPYNGGECELSFAYKGQASPRPEAPRAGTPFEGDGKMDCHGAGDANKDTGTITGCVFVAPGTSLSCDWSLTYSDVDKTIVRGGKLTATFSGDSLEVKWEVAPDTIKPDWHNADCKKFIAEHPDEWRKSANCHSRAESGGTTDFKRKH